MLALWKDKRSYYFGNSVAENFSCPLYCGETCLRINRCLVTCLIISSSFYHYLFLLSLSRISIGFNKKIHLPEIRLLSISIFFSQGWCDSIMAYVKVLVQIMTTLVETLDAHMKFLGFDSYCIICIAMKWV